MPRIHADVIIDQAGVDIFLSFDELALLNKNDVETIENIKARIKNAAEYEAQSGIDYQITSTCFCCASLVNDEELAYLNTAYELGITNLVEN